MAARFWSLSVAISLLNIAVKIFGQGSSTDPLNPCPKFTCSHDENLFEECPIGRFENQTCDTSTGTYMKYQQSLIFFCSKTEVTYIEASTDCCKRNMKLLSLETSEVRAFMADNYYFPSRIYVAWISAYFTSMTDNYWCNYWTGATSFNLRNGWSFTNMSTKTLDSGCLSYKVRLGTAGVSLYRSSCTSRSHYICYTNIDQFESTQCKKTCAKPQADLKKQAFEAAKTTNSSVGFKKRGEPLFFQCPSGKDYMAILDQYTNTEAWNKCCKYGLQLVRIETKEEIGCFRKFLGKTSGFFWTSGMNQRAGSTWCNTTDLLGPNTGTGPAPVNKALWAQNQPEEPLFNSCISLLLEVDQDSLTGLYASHASLRMPVICQFQA